MLRVAHIGDTSINDNKMLVETMKKAIKEAYGEENEESYYLRTYDLFIKDIITF